MHCRFCFMLLNNAVNESLAPKFFVDSKSTQMYKAVNIYYDFYGQTKNDTANGNLFLKTKTI